MKYIFITFIFLLTFRVNAQTAICERDSVTLHGRILTNIIDESQSGVTIRHSKSNEKFNAKRICQYSYEKIDSLNTLLTEEQVEQLFNCDNPVLKSAGFILFCKRNDKTEVIKKFHEILNERKGFMVSSCSDAIRITSFQQYCFEILNHQNLLYKPKFRLTKKEQKELTNELLNYEEVYWKN